MRDSKLNGLPRGLFTYGNDTADACTGRQVSRKDDPFFSHRSREQASSGVGRHRGIDIEDRAPVLFGHLRNAVEQITGYHRSLATGLDQNALVAGRVTGCGQGRYLVRDVVALVEQVHNAHLFQRHDAVLDLR